MRILVVCQRYFPEPFSITDICEELARRGHVVTVLTSLPCYGLNKIYPGYEKAWTDFRNGVHIIRVKTFPRKKGLFSLLLNYFYFWHYSRKKIKRIHQCFDVVYSMCLSPVTSVCAANLYARKNAVRHFHHCLDVWPESVVSVGLCKKDSFLYNVLFSLSKSIYLKMDSIFISSPSFREYLVDTIGYPSERIFYVPQPSRIYPNSDCVNFSHAFNFVFAGNIGSLQMVDSLVLASEKIIGKFDFCLHLIGSGSCVQKIRSLITSHHLEKNVIYEGRTEQSVLGKWYKNATALIVSLEPNKGIVSSTIPYKLISYLSYGKPVLAVLEGDGKKVAEQSGGCLVSGPSVEEIATSFSALMKLTDDERAAMGEKNKLFFQNNFSLQRVGDLLENQFLYFDSKNSLTQSKIK